MTQASLFEPTPVPPLFDHEAAARARQAEAERMEFDYLRHEQRNPPRVRNSDPISSHEAAEAVTESGLANAQAARVLEAVKEHPWLTSLELAAASGIDRYVLARRLPELRDAGYVLNGTPRPCKASRIGGRNVTTWAPK